MIRRTKSPQLHPLPILNLLRVRIPPLHRNIRISIGVHQDIEGAVSGELWEESDRGSDLAEDSCDFGLDLCFGLVC